MDRRLAALRRKVRHLLAELLSIIRLHCAGIAREPRNSCRVISASWLRRIPECARAGCARFQRDLFANKLAKDATQVLRMRRELHPKRLLLRIANRP
jgi:hypothetical protein